MVGWKECHFIFINLYVRVLLVSMNQTCSTNVMSATVDFYLTRSFHALCKWRKPLIAIYDIKIEDLSSSYLIRATLEMCFWSLCGGLAQ